MLRSTGIIYCITYVVENIYSNMTGKIIIKTDLLEKYKDIRCYNK